MDSTCGCTYVRAHKILELYSQWLSFIFTNRNLVRVHPLFLPLKSTILWYPWGRHSGRFHRLGWDNALGALALVFEQVNLWDSFFFFPSERAPGVTVAPRPARQPQCLHPTCGPMPRPKTWTGRGLKEVNKYKKALRNPFFGCQLIQSR